MCVCFVAEMIIAIPKLYSYTIPLVCRGLNVLLLALLQIKQDNPAAHKYVLCPVGSIPDIHAICIALVLSQRPP